MSVLAACGDGWQVVCSQEWFSTSTLAITRLPLHNPLPRPALPYWGQWERIDFCGRTVLLTFEPDFDYPSKTFTVHPPLYFRVPIFGHIKGWWSKTLTSCDKTL